MSCVISPSHGRTSGWMIYKRAAQAYHPYVYADLEMAVRKLGWYGDEIHYIELARSKTPRVVDLPSWYKYHHGKKVVTSVDGYTTPLKRKKKGRTPRG